MRAALLRRSATKASMLAGHAAPCQPACMSKTPMPDLDLAAACDCGAVTIHAAGRPISMFQCACRNCQKASGSGHSSVVLFPLDAVRTVGATKSFSRPADSGATFTRHFCPECGTTMVAESSRAPAFRIIPVGLFSGETEWYVPNQLIFARSHLDWDLVDAQMPHYDAYRPEKPK